MNARRIIISAAAVPMIALSLIAGKERVVLRTEFQDIMPKFIRFDDGRFSGISYELMEMLRRRTGIEFMFPDSPVPLSCVVMNLERGDMDVQIGIQKTAEREKIMIFGEPLYRVRTICLVRGDDAVDFASLEDLRRMGPERGTVLSIWGTAIASILKAVPGLAVDDSAKTVEDAIHKLRIGRGRVLIYHNLSLIYAAKNGEYEGRIRAVDIDYGRNAMLTDSYQYVTFSKRTDPAVMKIINNAVRAARADGELERITSKYLK